MIIIIKNTLVINKVMNNFLPDWKILYGYY